MCRVQREHGHHCLWFTFEGIIKKKKKKKEDNLQIGALPFKFTAAHDFRAGLTGQQHPSDSLSSALASLTRHPANESLAPADSAVNMSPDADDLYVPARPLVNRPVFPLRRRLMWRTAKHHTGVNHGGASRAAASDAGLYRTFVSHAAVRRRLTAV